MKLTKEFLMKLVGLEADINFELSDEFNEYDVIMKFKEISDEGLETFGLTDD